ncbi:MAG TPA: vitamin K epoxide reductase family protein [Pseudomonadota bacterium]|nr:vitamin K epoxide reductase family protein [Pseudomonadota bacterium]
MRHNARFAITSGLAAVGAALSVYLTTSHLSYLRSGLPSVCNINDTLNCDTVNSSPWAAIGGVPVSHLATLFYLGVLILSLLGRRGGWLADRIHGYLLVGAVGGGVFSAYLAGVAVFKIRALCLFCLGLDAVNLLLLAALLPDAWNALHALRGTPEQPGWVVDLRRLWRSPAVVLLALLVVFAGGSSWFLSAKLRELHARPAPPAVSPSLASSPLAPPSPASPAPPAGTPAPAKAEPRIDLDSQTAPTLGPATAKVTIVEISDFECPFCQRASGTIKELLAAYPDQLRVVFRHFPLDQACNPLLKRPVHENACAAARAAVCAAARGQFWPLAERLFAGNTDPEDLLTARRELHLDDAEQTACAQKPATAAVVAADIAACLQAGITAVPVFLINGRPLRGARPIAEFRRIIDEELQLAR